MDIRKFKPHFDKGAAIRLLEVARKYAIPALLVFLCGNDICFQVKSPVGNFSVARYSDAIGAIMKSSMCSSDKQVAASHVEPNAFSETYKAVISIAASSMCSSDKCAAIKAVFN